MSQELLSYKIKGLKLRRINELNDKLRDELGRERITASNACLAISNYVSTHRDYTLPEIWGYPPPGSNHFADATNKKRRSLQETGQSTSSACCTIM